MTKVSKRFASSLLMTFLVLLPACALLLAGCEQKTTAGQIVVEDVVVSTAGTEMHKSAVNQLLQDKTRDVQKLSRQFAGYFEGSFSLDHTKGDQLAQGVQVPGMMIGGKKLNDDHAIPDQLSQKYRGAVATIFARTGDASRNGDDFVRISTSLKRNHAEKADGSIDRATGTLLDRNHPAYNNIMAGAPYHGTAVLYSSVHMTEYTPIKDKGGAVIGIMFVGLDIGPDLVLLKRRLASS